MLLGQGTKWKERMDIEYCYWQTDKEVIDYFISGCRDSKVSYDNELLKCFVYCPNCGKKLKLTSETATQH